MLITFIEELPKHKNKIFIDYKFAFVLYKGEMQLYEIEVNKELDERKYDEIVNEVLYKRAKNRALYLIGAKDYTESMLRQKLTLNFYPETVIHRVVEFLKEYQYIDDECYTKQYIKFHGEKESVKAIKYKLTMKGIASDVIERNIEELKINSDDAIMKLVQRKYVTMQSFGKEKENKIISSLMRKGFRYNEVKRCIECVKVNIINEIIL